MHELAAIRCWNALDRYKMISYYMEPRAERNDMATKDRAGHHQAWLDSHPERSQEWLTRILAEGFDVHHLDGDRTNNSANNLILIETSDHNATLHGSKLIRPVGIDRLTPGAAERIRLRQAKQSSSDAQMYLLCVSGLPMDRIVGITGTYREVITRRAKRYALAGGLNWPFRARI